MVHNSAKSRLFSSVRHLFTNLLFLLLFVLPLASLFLVYTYSLPILQGFIDIQVVSTFSLVNLLRFGLLFSISSFVLAGYFHVNLYFSEANFKSAEKISYPLVNAFMVLGVIRFLRYFTDSVFYSNLSNTVVDFAVILPLIASSKIMKELLEHNEKNKFEILVKVSRINFSRTIIETICLTLAFGLVMYGFEFVVLSEIPHRLFNLIGPAMLIFTIFVLYVLRKPEFRESVKPFFESN